MKAAEATSAIPTPPVQRRHADDYVGESLNGMGFGYFDEDVPNTITTIAIPWSIYSSTY